MTSPPRADLGGRLGTAGEDNKRAHRALRAGVRIICDPTVVVSHLARHGPEGDCLASIGCTDEAMARSTVPGSDGGIASLRFAPRAIYAGAWLLMRGLFTRNYALISMGRGEITGLLPGSLQVCETRAYEARAHC